MRKKILNILILLLLAVVLISCADVSNSLNNQDESSDNQLQILKSDLKLTQDQVLSQIKAEHIKKYNGYLDSDEIIAIIQLEDDAIIETYLDRDLNTSIAQYATSSSGILKAQKLENKQNALIDQLKSSGLINDVIYTYDTVLNAIAVTTTYGNFKEIGQLASISSTLIADTYNRPQAVSDTSAIENLVDIYDTGIFDSSKVEYTGAGTAVAILDSGFDCSHSVFNTQPTAQVLTQQQVSKVLPNTIAASMTRGIDLFDVYYSTKIPFMYDYADKDADVFPYDSNHGTHVAGIIGGSDTEITGVAVNTQLVLMKVFPDLNDGANTADILAALEDAVLFGVDAINMSLGSSCGFAREEDGNAINAVYDNINKVGISLLTAASNSYSSAFGGEQGNTNKVTNPDSGTVGAPSTYLPALSVASISGTKSRYLVGNDSQVFFFKESNSVTGDENDFVSELGIKVGETKTFDYVTVPGVGLAVNYSRLDLTGKIALVRRGDNTFEEKALNAKNAGAIACIIYNNIEGDITMSMGKTDHIPTISISKDDGMILASQDSGTITISNDYQAGPFMSDFSSWGPTPSLQLKPEITAHGGNITSSVPGGGYDQLSGTSMATPNLCGIVLLIRQYVKENFEDYTPKEVTTLVNQLLMSTATIVLNEQGNPYSPRKQGAGLASLINSVTTSAFISVPDCDRTKLELLDDPERSGVYVMNFNINNITDKTLKYDTSVIGMTESVSTSDDEYVSEVSQLLHGATKIEVLSGGSLSNNTITVEASETARVRVTYTLPTADKELIDSLFPYGMYVEGFVKLTAQDNEVDLSVPFLAFYGDWTEAPLFDKTYYEVESEAHNAAIDDEDKIKADYYATTPYGSYFYNYLIPLGTYLYDIDETKYDAIPASEDKISISNILGTVDGIASIYAGLLRNAKTMTYTITDKLTGDVIYEFIDYNANKAHYSNMALPYYEFLRLRSTDLGLTNNRQYQFKMVAALDYGDGGLTTNARNAFSFDFFLDDEAPVVKDATYEKVYDRTLKKDRYYVTLTVYDNQYVQSITPIIFTSTSSYDFLTENPIPVYSEKGEDAKVRFEITDFLEDIEYDALITSGLAFSVDDYALNSNIYICQLPGTKGDFKFTKDGTTDGTELLILSMYEDEVVDLTDYLSTSDDSVDSDKDYLKYLVWSSSNENVATIEEGLVRGIKAGRTTIIVQEQMELKQAVLIINVKERPGASATNLSATVDVDDQTIDSIRFAYFDTLFAYSRAAQTSEIGETGDRRYISSVGSLSFYPGEKIQLGYDFDPWYLEDKYELTYSSTNPDVAIVDQDGVVTALKEGNTNIVLSVAGSNLMARLRVSVKSEFIIENRTLIAYKGLGGDVVIPDDEGILYIGSYAFCLYDTDRTIELSDDDYDANKIPSMNTTVTSVTIPEGVEEIQRFAFYNCPGLVDVNIPSSTKVIREYAFYNDGKLKNIDLSNIEVIGREAFRNCTSLETANLVKTYTIGANAFDNCSSLKTADLTALRNSGREIFRNCTGLESVTLTENTKLSYAMFVGSGLKEIDIYEKVQIPAFCFAQCENLSKVNIHNDLVYVGEGAFSECLNLTEVNFLGKVETFADQVFYHSTALKTITLPNNALTLGNYCFFECSALEEVIFQANTVISKINGSIFQDTALSKFTVDASNNAYTASNGLLLSKDGTKIIFAAVASVEGDYIVDEKYTEIGDGAFAGTNLTSLTITNPLTKIGDYAFANCEKLETIILPSVTGTVIGNHSFNYSSALTEVQNLDKVQTVGEYAFANSGINNVTIGEGATFGEGAFFRSKVQTVTIGANSKFGLGAFQDCLNLITVNMPEAGNVHFGVACFANDASLATIDLSKVDSVIEDQTFYGCASLKIANLVNVEEVGEYAFADCATLNYLSVPKVITIKQGAFARYATNGGAPQITEVTLPETLTTLGDGAFLGCEGLAEVTLPSSLETIGDYLFAYCVHLEKVTLPENLTNIGVYWFAGCEVLVTINLENVEVIGNYAFTSCVSLETVDLSSATSIGEGSFASTYLSGNITASNVVEVKDFAFQNTRMTTFTAPKLETIGFGAFQNNTQMIEFVFSNQLSSIDIMAFNGCSRLTSFYYLDNGQKVTDGKINDYAFLSDGILYSEESLGKYELKSVPAAKNIDTLVVLDGTYRVDARAGNDNENVTKIVLPDSLRSIGNYAFYGYKNLGEVEFKSVSAPILENSYTSNAELTEEDPGYAVIHKYLDLFNYYLCYYQFIDLVGKKDPIKMTLPANSNISGYDGIVYLVYFGSVSDATRSTYQAMEQSMVDFIKYAEEIQKIKTVTSNDEKLINNALTVYNSIKQNATDYGYTASEWQTLVDTVNNAKKDLLAIQLVRASKEVQNLQAEINQLPTTFNITLLETLSNISQKINRLSVDERTILDLTTYNTLVNSYNQYVQSINAEVTPLINSVNNGLTQSLTLVGLVLIGLILRKRFML